jgi:AcrR family transcriptional regulator
MSQIKELNLDPRTRRTRELLQQALSGLLDTREFDTISVQDITEAATINRATFYAHYADKFALLECVIATRFNEFLASRAVQFDTTCETALANIILAVSDYLVDLCGKNIDKQIQPQIELAIITVVKRMLLTGFKKHATDKPIAKPIAPEMIAATVSWAIYGAVKEWTQTQNRSSVEDMVASVVLLVKPIFQSSN